ncbi:MAG: BC1872 family protein [Chloroflexia bacterium]
MVSGRALDLLVAEHVMGWPAPMYITDEEFDPARPIYGWLECPADHEHGDACSRWQCGKHSYYPPPAYSSDIAAAWTVVEALGLSGFRLQQMDDKTWSSGFRLPGRGSGGRVDAEGHARAKTAPLAICLAALKVVGVEVPA